MVVMLALALAIKWVWGLKQMNKLIYAFFVLAGLLLAVIFMPSSATIQAMQKATATPIPLKCNQVLPFVQKAGTACSKVDRDQICYGSRTVDVEFAEGTDSDNLSFIPEAGRYSATKRLQLHQCFPTQFNGA
jgi:hypothetical protein